MRYCSACHGNDGTARINGATNLRQSSLDSARLLKIVREGRNKMPSFKTQLSIEETSEIVSYILTLSKEE
ncbi:c-type cytochrome [Niabella digestorum]|uniref:c-type cytochrome n=1 Tax=Niabella digestorum TaxID=3117701 RepID=UPI003AFF6D3A